MATTAFCSSAKTELLSGAHTFLATNATNTAVSGVNGAFTLTGLTSTAGLVVGMAATGTNVASGAVIASIDSATQVTLSKAHTGTITTQTITFTGDVMKMLLIKVAPSTTFAATQTNVGTPGTAASSVTNVGTDEVTGTGYVANGTTLVNVSPVLTTATAFTTFSPNPNWTTATFSATACIIYNSSVRLGHANGITPNASGSAINRSISVHDFGGTQQVTSGTFTVVMPTADLNNAILRLA